MELLEPGDYCYE